MHRQFDAVEQFFEFLLVVTLDGLGHDFPGQVRREFLDEIAHETAQEGATTETDLGHAGFEQLAGVQYHQITVELGIDGHLRDDAHAQARRT